MRIQIKASSEELYVSLEYSNHTRMDSWLDEQKELSIYQFRQMIAIKSTNVTEHMVCANTRVNEP